jgi:hypothetical protein
MQVQPFYRQLRARNHDEPRWLYAITGLLADSLSLSPKYRMALSAWLEPVAAVVIFFVLVGTIAVSNRIFLGS